MLDIRKIKENPDAVKAGLKAKEVDCDAVIDRILELDVAIRGLKTSSEGRTAQKNKLAKENGKLYGKKKGLQKKGQDTAEVDAKIAANTCESIKLDEENAADLKKLDELNAELYAIPKAVYGTELSEKELKGVQGAFFRNVYKLLIDKERGPRLYLFLYAIEADKYVGLLDFSYEKTVEEAKAEEDAKAEVIEETEDKHVYGEADAFVPFKEEQVSIDYFEKLDLRVCEIVKAQEIRKSHSCLKLTLNDGSGENRTIVSSIKSEYTCEQLVGKKIIVIANLEPARFSGVQSDGMLLAATNGACGCQVVFLPDCVPAGTQIK